MHWLFNAFEEAGDYLNYKRSIRANSALIEKNSAKLDALENEWNDLRKTMERKERKSRSRSSSKSPQKEAFRPWTAFPEIENYLESPNLPEP
jgi:hypothetical protein